MTLGDAHPPGTTLDSLIDKGELAEAWRESTHPDRKLPLLLPETQLLVVVSGDPTRNRSCFYRQNFKQGYATSKKIALPVNWKA